MKKLVVFLAILAITVPVIASPTTIADINEQLGNGGPSYSKNCWDFEDSLNPTQLTAGSITPYGPAVLSATFSDNPNYGAHINPKGFVNGSARADIVVFDIVVPNDYVATNAKYLKISVDFWGGFDKVSIQGYDDQNPANLIDFDFVGHVTSGLGSNIDHLYWVESGVGTVELYYVARPQPEYENIQLTFSGTGAVINKLCVETVCVPAPGALILGSLGTAFVGWIRRRRA